MILGATSGRMKAAVLGAILAVAVVGYWVWLSDKVSTAEVSATTAARADAPNTPASEPGSVDLTESQLTSVKVAPVEERDFPIEKDAVGSIDFNENMETQVFTPYQGRIIALFAEIGDDVKKGQTLFTIDSPDL